MNYGFYRVAAVSPNFSITNCEENSKLIIKKIKEAEKLNIQILVFPELSLTTASCGDLFLQDILLKNSKKYIKEICKKTEKTSVLSLIGLPLEVNNTLYNCAFYIQSGKILAIIPKSNEELSEIQIKSKNFSSYNCDDVIYINDNNLSDKAIPFGSNIILEDINNPKVKISSEIGEDFFAPISPATLHCINGANIILNASAINHEPENFDTIKKELEIFTLKNNCTYIFSNASNYESTSDMVFSGKSYILQQGNCLEENQAFSKTEDFLISDIDIEKKSHSKIKSKKIIRKEFKKNYLTIKINQKNLDYNKDKYFFSKTKSNHFISDDSSKNEKLFIETINIQANALKQRLESINCKHAVLGLSGGLDSTLALLATKKAFELANITSKNIICITMPCFGTSDRTYNNAINLAKELDTTLIEINIKNAVLQHFKDINHDENIKNITYENSQARERTQILMDYANKINGIVIGTGDLSELALGWCTYNGDHMSMYGINASIPKTLIFHLVEHCAKDYKNKNQNKISEILFDIIETPVSPELIPPEKNSISQKTEEIVGPYELHDFFLYHILKWGFSPRKILFLAEKTFAQNKYDRKTILKWLKIFYRRFFTQQFKRNCMPDGAKAGPLSLSPREGWKMPSDASYKMWDAELNEILGE